MTPVGRRAQIQKGSRAIASHYDAFVQIRKIISPPEEAARPQDSQLGECRLVFPYPSGGHPWPAHTCLVVALVDQHERNQLFAEEMSLQSQWGAKVNPSFYKQGN